MTDDMWAEFGLTKARDEMKDGHSAYVRGIVVLALVVLAAAASVYLAFLESLRVLANPSTPATPDFTWLEVTVVLLPLGAVCGLTQLYVGIHRFMAGTRKAVDWMVMLHRGERTSEDMPPPLD